MNKLVLLGVVLLLVGAGLMVFDEIRYDEKHSTEIFGAEISATTTETRRIPQAVGGTIMGVGALVALIGALKRK